MAVTTEAVIDRLQAVVTPDGSQSLPASGRLSEIVIRKDHVALSISIEPHEAPLWDPARTAAERAVTAIPGVAGVTVVLTADRQSEPVRAAPFVSSPSETAHAKGFPSLAHVRRIVAVASGKGGVGKSTTACNVALALSLGNRSESGRPLRVGVLDADIYGPSIPKLLGLKGAPRIVSNRTLEPMEAYGMKVMSIGFLVDTEKAMIWRGPMVASAVTQLLRDIAWGELDVLVVDMPPGTGDAQLTLSQQAPLSGAVIVSTPQDLALIDARRGIAMFREVGVPVIGLVENMSYFFCDDCGKRHDIFGHGGARAESARLDVPFLGEVPLDLAIRERSDEGLPIVTAEPDSPAALAYMAVAEAIRRRLGERP